MRLVDAVGNEFAPAFSVYDPTGAAIVTGVNGEDVAGAAFTAQTSGMFTVVVSDASSTSTSTGEYNLYVVVAPGANECGVLIPGDVVSENIEKGALQSYTFSALAGEGVMLRITDVAGGPLLPAFSVYDPAGSLVSQAVGEDVAGLAFTTQKSGTFTVVVYDASTGLASTGPYNLYFTLAPGADKGGALIPGDVISDRIDEGELDSYTFTAQAGEGVALRVTDITGGPLLPGFIVYDPTGAAVDNAQGEDVAGIIFTTQVSGTFTLVVYDASDGMASTGPYNLYFTLAPGADKGGALSPGGVVSGQIAEGEIDSYTLDAQTGDKVAISVTDESGGPLVPTLIVYDPSGTTVIEAQDPDIASATFTVATSGTFTVIVSDGSNGLASTGPYDLSFTLMPPSN